MQSEKCDTDATMWNIGTVFKGDNLFWHCVHLNFLFRMNSFESWVVLSGEKNRKKLKNYNWVL